MKLLRKRHIGNDIVTIVFQEPGALPFSAKTFRSHFQHVFIVVRVANPCTELTTYSLSVSRSSSVPPFGPPLRADTRFKADQQFVDLLLTKAINGENAVHQSDKFAELAVRTRFEYLKDLALNHVSSVTLEQAAKAGRFSLGSMRKRDSPKRPKNFTAHLQARGALVWPVRCTDYSFSAKLVDAYLAVSYEQTVIVQRSPRQVLFAIPNCCIIGWTANEKRQMCVFLLSFFLEFTFPVFDFFILRHL